jgi:hypothetical protein
MRLSMLRFCRSALRPSIGASFHGDIIQQVVGV